MFFWTFITIGVYYGMLKLNERVKLPFFNSVLFSGVLLMGVLLFLKIDYENYQASTLPITSSLGPFVVLLAVPLYKNKEGLKRHASRVILGIILGGGISTLTVVVLSYIMGIEKDLMLALIPKSITTPMAITFTETLGGIVGVSVFSVIITGLFGAAFFPMVKDLFKINNPLAIGIALGSTSHAIGTAKALEIDEEAGGYSGLAMGLTGLIFVIIGSIINMFI